MRDDKKQPERDKYEEAFWTVVGTTGLGLFLMWLGAQYHSTAVIQIGIAIQALGTVGGMWIARRGGGWRD